MKNIFTSMIVCFITMWVGCAIAHDDDPSNWHLVTGRQAKRQQATANSRAKKQAKELSSSAASKRSGQAITGNDQDLLQRNNIARQQILRELADLNILQDAFLKERQVSAVNIGLYNQGPKGKLGANDRDENLLKDHMLLFCSPDSGYEQKMFLDNCQQGKPLDIQHGDIKPAFLLSNALTPPDTRIADNYIANIASPAYRPQLLDVAKEPKLFAKPEVRREYARLLRRQMYNSVAVNSFHTAIAKRIPKDPQNTESHSELSAMRHEVASRHIDPNWHKTIDESEPLILIREQVKLQALQNEQLLRLQQTMERVELLLAVTVLQANNQPEMLAELTSKIKDGS